MTGNQMAKFMPLVVNLVTFYHPDLSENLWLLLPAVTIQDKCQKVVGDEEVEQEALVKLLLTDQGEAGASWDEVSGYADDALALIELAEDLNVHLREFFSKRGEGLRQ